MRTVNSHQSPVNSSQKLILWLLVTGYWFAFMFIVNTADGAPDAPLNFDGWVTDALAKLEMGGVTGGFHRQTKPLSRAEIAAVIRQAESRIRTGTVIAYEIDRKLLEKLKRAFRRELAVSTGQTLRFLPQLRATDRKIAPALETAFHYTAGGLEDRIAPRFSALLRI